MGLNWSQARIVKDGTTLMTYASMPCDTDAPDGKEATQKIWGLWREHKDALKADGFSIKKGEFGRWQVYYWHTIANGDHEKDATGRPQWRLKMIAKMDRWGPILAAVVVEDQGRRGRKTQVDAGDLSNETVDAADLIGDLGAPEPQAAKPAPRPALKPAPNLTAKPKAPAVKPAPKVAPVKAPAKAAPKVLAQAPAKKPAKVDPKLLLAMALDDDGDY